MNDPHLLEAAITLGVALLLLGIFGAWLRWYLTKADE